VLAVLALALKSRGTRWLFAVGMWAATAVTFQTALHGGEIEHNEEARTGVVR
jgi:hypothetical protein